MIKNTSQPLSRTSRLSVDSETVQPQIVDQSSKQQHFKKHPSVKLGANPYATTNNLMNTVSSHRKSIRAVQSGFKPNFHLDDMNEQHNIGDIEGRSFFKCPFRKELDESSKEAVTKRIEFLKGPTQHLVPRTIKPPNSLQGHIDDLKVLFKESSDQSV